MKELISIVIPIYNVERYLCKCLESVQHQTYENIEIILVDDGSPDGCSSICDEYAGRDSRIRVIHKTNGGLSDARNAGIALAKGKFITFIDSDDYVAANYVEVLYHSIIAADADIAMICGETVFEDAHPVSGTCLIPDVQIFTQKEAVYNFLQMRDLKHNAWGKLYATELFRQIRFPVGELYEDLAVIYQVLLQVKKIAYCDAPLYYYLMRQGSIMQTPFDMRQYVEVRWIEQAMALVEKEYPEFEAEIRGRRVWSYFKTLYRILCSKDRRKYILQQNELISKIRIESQGLVNLPNINRNLKIKILSLLFGRYVYYGVQKLSDTLKYIKAGHRYTI